MLTLASQTGVQFSNNKKKLGSAYLIGFVVILWIVFRDLGLLVVAEVSNEFIHTKLFPPLLTFDKPFFGGGDNLLAGNLFV